MPIAQPGMNMDQDRQMLMVEDNVGNQFRPNAMQNVENQVVQNTVQNPGIQTVENMNGLSVVSGIANQHGNGDVVAAQAEVKPRKLDAAYLQKQMQIAQKEEAGIQLTSEEFDFMAAAGACEETERANANCTLENNLQLASTSGTQSDKAPVYDSDGSTEVHHSENCYDNDIFNMFTQEEQYTKLLEPIPEPHQAQQNDSNVISEVSSVEQSGRTVDHHPANNRFTTSTGKWLLGYQNPFYLKQAQQKQQSLYNGKALLEKYDPPVVYDSEENWDACLQKVAYK
ncbi:hypothetical protein Tco_0072554 [Tanacetum coccineum]